MATNPYSYGSLGQRWTVGEPTSKSLLDVSRVKADANRWALEQLVVDPDDTANFVLTAPGLNIDSNTLYVDSVNNSVGFGLTNPNDYAFNGTPSWVASGGAGNASVIVVSGTTSIGYLAFADGTTGTDRYSGNIQYNHSTNTMSFRTNGGVEAMTINSAQDLAVDTDTLFVDASADRVGINTSSADASLHIEGSSVSDLVKVEDTGTDSNPNIQIANDARSYNLQVVGARSDAFEIWDRTAGATRLAITSAGNVGISTTSPVELSGYKLLTISDTSGGGLVCQYNGTSKLAVYSANNDGYYDAAVKHVFRTGGVFGGSTAMTLDSTGLGIGTNSPSTLLQLNETYGTAALSISDDSSAGDYLTFQIVGGQYNGGANEIQAINTTDLSLNVATARSLIFKTNNTERARITSDGDLLIGETSNQTARVYATTSTVGDYAYVGVTTDKNRGPAFFNNTSSTFDSIMLQLYVTRAATNGYDFARFNSGNGADLEFRFRGDGEAYADGAWNGSGADYQEYFESASGEAAEVGRAIVLDGDKVRYYNADTDSTDDIMGVTRPQADNKNSAVVGNTAWNHWTDKYLTDDWGVYLREDVTVWTYTNEKNETFDVYERDELAKDPNWTPPEGATSSTQSVRKLNPDYDESLDNTYQSREVRDEWWLVGLLGQIQVKAGEPVNPRWIKMKNISDAVELYYVR